MEKGGLLHATDVGQRSHIAACPTCRNAACACSGCGGYGTCRGPICAKAASGSKRGRVVVPMWRATAVNVGACRRRWPSGVGSEGGDSESNARCDAGGMFLASHAIPLSMIRARALFVVLREPYC